MKALRLSLAALAGLVAYAMVFQRPLALAMLSKASGGDQPCPWSALIRYPWLLQDFADKQVDVEKQLVLAREDPAMGIQLIRTAGRAFWVKTDGKALGGKSTLAYVIAEQAWIANHAARDTCNPETSL